MSASAASVKLSPAIKQLIALPKARGASLPSPGTAALNDLFARIKGRGERGGVKKDTWLTVLTAGVMTVNSPESLCGVYDFASSQAGLDERVQNAAVSRRLGFREGFGYSVADGRLCARRD